MRKVVFVYKDLGGATRYRVFNMIEALKESCKWSGRAILTSKIGNLKLDDIDLIIIDRQTAKNNQILNLIKRAHKIGIKVIFDLDDLVFNYCDLSVLMQGTGQKNAFYWTAYLWGIRRIALRVDGFIATNKFLAGQLSSCFSKPAMVIRNFLNKAQVVASEQCLPKSNRSGFLVGYFSGTSTHSRDFQMIEPKLVSFLERHPDAKLNIVGVLDLSMEMKKLKQDGRVNYARPVDFVKLQKLIADVDINIAPLIINKFTNCKSELKFFEAAIVETPTIASPNFAFSNAILDGVTGFLAEPDEWGRKLEFAYQNPNKLNKISRNARQYALDKYFGKTVLKEIESVYEFFAE